LERLVLAIGTKELGSAIGHPALELGAGEALVDDGEAGERTRSSISRATSGTAGSAPACVVSLASGVRASAGTGGKAR
jgi:hypothetical protein